MRNPLRGVLWKESRCSPHDFQDPTLANSNEKQDLIGTGNNCSRARVSKSMPNPFSLHVNHGSSAVVRALGPLGAGPWFNASRGALWKESRCSPHDFQDPTLANSNEKQDLIGTGNNCSRARVSKSMPNPFSLHVNHGSSAVVRALGPLGAGPWFILH